jgi:hypothetical protein
MWQGSENRQLSSSASAFEYVRVETIGNITHDARHTEYQEQLETKVVFGHLCEQRQRADCCVAVHSERESTDANTHVLLPAPRTPMPSISFFLLT